MPTHAGTGEGAQIFRTRWARRVICADKAVICAQALLTEVNESQSAALLQQRASQQKLGELAVELSTQSSAFVQRESALVDVITALQKDKDWLQLEVAAMRTAAQDAEKDIRKEIDRLKLDNLRSTSAASDIKRELDISASENVLLQASFSSSRLSAAPPPAAPPPPPLAAAGRHHRRRHHRRHRRHPPHRQFQSVPEAFARNVWQASLRELQSDKTWLQQQLEACNVTLRDLSDRVSNLQAGYEAQVMYTSGCGGSASPTGTRASAPSH